MKRGQTVSQLQSAKVSITDFINEDGTIYYNIVVIHFTLGKQWRIKARYSILSDLNENVLKYTKKQKNPKLCVPTFPPKKWWAIQDDVFLNQRKVELQTYLQELLKQENAIFIDPISEFLGFNESDDQLEISMNDKLNRLRTEHDNKQPHKGVTSTSSNTNQAHYEQSVDLDKQSQDIEISFPLSFCEVSMGQRNQQVCLGSFAEDIQSIRRRSVDFQSDFNDNSSIMLFFPSPPNYKNLIPLPANNRLSGKDESILRSQIENQKSCRSSELTYTDGQTELDQSDSTYQNIVQQAMNCINKNKTVQPNVYSYNLEEYKATQRKFKREVEQIIESSEISSGIEQNIFFDSDEESVDENNSSYIKRKENQTNQRQSQKQQNQQQSYSKSQCRCYNSDSDSYSDSESRDSESENSCAQQQNKSKSKTKSLQLTKSKQNPIPLMQRSTDDDCAHNKRRTPIKNYSSQCQNYNYDTENILQFLQNSSQSIKMKSNESQDQNESSDNDSTKTIYKNGEEEEDKIQNNSNILDDISQNSFTQRSPTVCIQNPHNQMNNNIQNSKANHLKLIENLIEMHS